MRKNYAVNRRINLAWFRMLRSEAKTKQKGLCRYCKEPLRYSETTGDHVVPRKVGGRDRNNIAAACKACNSLKGHMSENQFKKAIRHPEGRTFSFWLANQRFRLWRRVGQAERRIKRFAGIEETAA